MRLLIVLVGIKLDIHPLALEDVLHARGHARSKADYYTKHLFLRLLCHTLGQDEDNNASQETLTNLPRSASPIPFDDDDEDDDEFWAREEKGEDDEKTVYGNGSRYSTTRGGPLQKHAKSRIQTDIEKQGPASARFPDFDQQVGG